MLSKKSLGKKTVQLGSFSLAKNSPNEDAVLAVDLENSGCLIAVADGVGGNPDGDLASRTGIQVIHREISNEFDIDLSIVFKRVVDGLAKAAPDIPIATTLTLVRSSSFSFEVGHVGDTRAYHLRGYGILSLTSDQNEGEELLRQGVFSRKNILAYPRRNVLTSALSIATSHHLQITQGKAVRGDRILIVSDGVHGMIKKQELAQINQHSTSVSSFLSGIEARLQERGLKDDASAACIEFIG